MAAITANKNESLEHLTQAWRIFVWLLGQAVLTWDFRMSLGWLYKNIAGCPLGVLLPFLDFCQSASSGEVAMVTLKKTVCGFSRFVGRSSEHI